MKNNRKEIERLLKGSEETFILVTKNGSGTVGYTHEILTLLTMLIRDVKKIEGITDEMIEEAFKLSSMNQKELLESVLEELKEIAKKEE